jgi:hypothetical protein
MPAEFVGQEGRDRHHPARLPEGDAASLTRPTVAKGKETRVFRRKWKPPGRAFIHDDCRIAKVDPDVEIPWSHLGEGLWRRECLCTYESSPSHSSTTASKTNRSIRGPAATLGQCEYVTETDPVELQLLLKIKPGLGEGYDWVEGGACGAGWPVARTTPSGSSALDEQRPPIRCPPGGSRGKWALTRNWSPLASLS